MKKIISVIFVAAILFACNDEAKKSEVSATETKSETGKAPVELINDSNLINSVKAAFTAFENKDIEGYTANLADNVMFRWSGGDSLVEHITNHFFCVKRMRMCCGNTRYQPAG